MDEIVISDRQVLAEGFPGQRMIVLPRPVVRASQNRPVTSRLLVTDAGYFPVASRHGMARESGAEQHILLVCTTGTGWCRTPAGRVMVRSGDAVVLQAGVPHDYLADQEDPWTLWWLHVSGDDATELVRTALAAVGGPITHLRDANEVARLIHQTIDALDTGTVGGLVSASGAAFHAFTTVIATGRRNPGPAPSPVERAVEHLRATSPARTSVSELAAMVGLSASHFGALFRQQVGVSPLRYQTDLRMARARELLDSSDWTVLAISTDCGYDDALYFTRQFTRLHGLSPSAYRAREL